MTIGQHNRRSKRYARTVLLRWLLNRGERVVYPMRGFANSSSAKNYALLFLSSEFGSSLFKIIEQVKRNKGGPGAKALRMSAARSCVHSSASTVLLSAAETNAETVVAETAVSAPSPAGAVISCVDGAHSSLAGATVAGAQVSCVHRVAYRCRNGCRGIDRNGVIACACSGGDGFDVCFSLGPSTATAYSVQTITHI